MQYKSIMIGFSLIELMIVVTIIGILATIGLPSYQKYVKRARFSEVIAATEEYKTAVALALQEGVPLEDLSSGKEGIPTSPKKRKHVASIEVTNGVITATGTERIDNATYTLTPNKEGTEWQISGTCIKAGLCSGA